MAKAASKTLLIFTFIGILSFWLIFFGSDRNRTGALYAQSNQSNEEIAFQLAATFRACRAVVAKNKKYIHKPSETITKGSIDTVITKMRKQIQILYKTMTKKPYPKDDGSEASKLRKLLEQSFEKVLQDYADGKLDLKWKGDNDYVKKWDGKMLPARFAAHAAKNFNEATQGRVTIKLTTSNKLLVNKDNAPDDWESETIEKYFYNTSLKNQAAAQSKDGDASFRYMLPEYYAKGCIKCHGSAKGQDGPKIHPNGEGRNNLSCAGAISVKINK